MKTIDLLKGQRQDLKTHLFDLDSEREAVKVLLLLYRVESIIEELKNEQQPSD
tara:strand:+ start:458 stop:616 length:159 start_codon:yes stop_codon:yes gene_type:complete